MKNHLRNYVTSALLLLPVSAAMLGAPSAAMAQPATPELGSLNVTADAGLRPGSRLTFRLTGTPRARATIRIRGLRDLISLRETTPGVFVGGYTVKRNDRLDGDTEVRASLRHGNRVVSAAYDLDETMTAVIAPAPAPVPAPVPVAVPVPQPLRIERFGMAPVERIEPGAELVFALEGQPGATVSVDLPGVDTDVRMRETRPGFYEGSYTLRRADNLNPNRPFVATLRLGDRFVTSNLNMLAARPAADNRQSPDNRPPSLVNMSPRDGEAVAGGPPVHITANFQDYGGSGVDPASVQIVVSGRNVTRESQINRDALSFRGVLPPGRHTVDVTARDQAGNAVRQGWSFDVVAAAPVNVPITILNHGNNGQIGQGPTRVEGRTVPNANVAVNVSAVAPIGGVLNISQELLSQNVQADANGNFAFTFVPQFPVPGTRYDITLVSTRGNLRDDHRLVLVQR